MEEINLLEHSFKHEMFHQIMNDYSDFDYHYFDDPDRVTGFGGFHEDGNGAEGARDFKSEAELIASIPGVHTVLDVGCAKGYLVKALRQMGFEAHGIDISDYAVQNSDPQAKPFLRVLRVQELGPTEKYDIIHARGVFVYLTLSEIKKTLQQLFEVARLGVVIADPTREQIQEWYDQRDLKALDACRKQELTDLQWQALIEDAGFCKNGVMYKKPEFAALSFSASHGTKV